MCGGSVSSAAYLTSARVLKICDRRHVLYILRLHSKRFVAASTEKTKQKQKTNWLQSLEYKCSLLTTVFQAHVVVSFIQSHVSGKPRPIFACERLNLLIMPLSCTPWFYHLFLLNLITRGTLQVNFTDVCCSCLNLFENNKISIYLQKSKKLKR